MNWHEIEGNPKQLKGKAQSQWSKLTDDDLTLINGKRTELAGLLRTRYAHAKEQASREIDLWTRQIKQK